MQLLMHNSQNTRRAFDKYKLGGAYHWKECDRLSRRFNPPLVARYQVVIDCVESAAQVLEIGSGDGRLTASLAESSAKVVGIEIDNIAVRLAASALQPMENCVIAQADCYRLPFLAEKFDVVVMADVIEHLDKPEAALAEVARVLKSDGTLILTTPKWRPDRVWDVYHVHEYTPSEITNCLKNFFECVKISYFWPLFWSNVYSTKIGWRILRVYARYFTNPFLRVGSAEEGFGQILAVCYKSATISSSDTDLPGAVNNEH
jgi:2-polyprenyl-3-methyl-5-hydroxy-6-metoxy-1,4-benzoquinol methylase